MKKTLIGLGIISGLFIIAYTIYKTSKDKELQEKRFRAKINKGYRCPKINSL